MFRTISLNYFSLLNQLLNLKFLKSYFADFDFKYILKFKKSFKNLFIPIINSLFIIILKQYDLFYFHFIIYRFSAI